MRTLKVVLSETNTNRVNAGIQILSSAYKSSPSLSIIFARLTMLGTLDFIQMQVKFLWKFQILQWSYNEVSKPKHNLESSTGIFNNDGHMWQNIHCSCKLNSFCQCKGSNSPNRFTVKSEYFCDFKTSDKSAAKTMKHNS